MEAGTWDAMTGTITITESDLDQIASSFSLLDLAGRVPLKFGHNDSQPLTDGQPALGWVSSLYRQGKKLLGDFTDIPKLVYDLIKAGRYKYLSVELLGDIKAGSRVIPWVLDAVALLGADQPAIGTLKDLQSLTMARGSGLQSSVRAALTRATPLTGGQKPTMADDDKQKDDVKALLERLNAAEKERDTLRLQAARTTEAETKLTELQTQTRNEKITGHRATLMALFEAPIKDKKILPSVREQFKRVYKTETESVLDVTSADAEVFMRANPNPDAPKPPASLGTNDPNDPAEKAMFSARAAAAVAAVNPANREKPRDQILVEAMQAEFRRNPDLGKAWQDAPGSIGSK